MWQPGSVATDTAASGVFRSGADAVRLSGDTVFVAAWHFVVRNGHRSEAWLVALDRRTGAEHWRLTLPVMQTGVGIQAQPALWGNLVIVSTVSGHVFAVDRTVRTITWQAAPDARLAPNEPLAAVVASPAVAGDIVYHDGGNRHLYARRASDGTILWTTRDDGQFTHDLLVTATRIYGTTGGYLNIFDRDTGRRRAKLEQPRISSANTLFSSAASAADRQVFITVNGAAWSFDEP